MDKIAPFKKLLSNVVLNATRPPPTRTEGNTDYGRINTKEVDLTAEYLMHLFFDEQKSKCYWLDVELNPNWIFVSHHPLSLSVDRLNSDYKKGEVVICSRMANLGRQNWPEEDFKNVVRYLKSQWGWDEYLLSPPIQMELI
jgi:hypothetical protein